VLVLVARASLVSLCKKICASKTTTQQMATRLLLSFTSPFEHNHIVFAIPGILLCVLLCQHTTHNK
jgi:hypothetical protein